MQTLGCPLSVHVYNALIAVCEHENQWDQVLQAPSMDTVPYKAISWALGKFHCYLEAHPYRTRCRCHSLLTLNYMERELCQICSEPTRGGLYVATLGNIFTSSPADVANLKFLS